MLGFIRYKMREMEKEMATSSNILTWKIPWTEELGRLQSMGSQRIRHNGVHTHIYIHTHTKAKVLWTQQES